MKATVKVICLLFLFLFVACENRPGMQENEREELSPGIYKGEYLERIAFPIGGIGAGMICIEGAGAISNVSVRNEFNFLNEPTMFAAISVKDFEGASKVLEGPVPKWKYFGEKGSGNGSKGATYGLPRFSQASFKTHFPFGIINLEDEDVPLQVEITGWSPFIPLDTDNSSLPVGAIEYTFSNPTNKTLESVFSYHSRNFMSLKGTNKILPLENGFILNQPGTKENPEIEGSFAMFIEEDGVSVDYSWYGGAHYDDITLVWNTVESGALRANPPQKGPSPGASIYLPFTLKPGEEKTITLKLAWYVPHTDLRYGRDPGDIENAETYIPWYAGTFKKFSDLIDYWKDNFDDLRKKTTLFSETFYDTTLPEEVVDAVAANLTILKTPTILRQKDNRMWAFEGCSDDRGCCPGSCTHVWNYAQAIPHLFPDLERSLRETEFNENQGESGRQTFRAPLPIRPASQDPEDYLPGRYAAADGQLGGIMKVYRDWRALWPQVKSSMNYCINTWDPRHKGIMDEPQHNTYDIQFWGPNGMIGSFYLGALNAYIQMSEAMGEENTFYKDLYEKGKAYMESELFNGEYFIQQVKTEGLNAEFIPLGAEEVGPGYEDVIERLNEEGPKYQYGSGCLSDGVLGSWIAKMCGMEDVVDPEKIKSHLLAVHKYNLKEDLSKHSNPQRPTYALGDDGGLLLCTWPRGGKITIPFIYSNEVWTGIEYQVASHLMLHGEVEKALEIVRLCRSRYDGKIRNPFDEYECGHWYGRALASYGMLQGLTGIRYDAITKTLFIDSKIGDDFRAFFSGQSGFGTIGLKNGKPFVEIASGDLEVNNCFVSGEKVNFSL
jgi:uncharacterized protein (DUF608 family)